jgi:hypothetical protein
VGWGGIKEMNKQESFDFDQTHKYNSGMVEQIAQAYKWFWIKCGRPKEVKDNEDFKHFHVFMSGVIQRCFEAIKDEEKKYIDGMRKQVLKKLG